MAIPSVESWEYFMKHHDDIRGVCSQCLPRKSMEVPNSYVTVGQNNDRPLLRANGEEIKATVPLKVTHTIKDFDEAVKAKDSIRLTRIMNRAWLALPESRSIYGEPGVTEMCNLLDCTVDGFFDDPDKRDMD